MNYLAHAYLSFNQPEILVGNMISDFVKGKKKYDYPSGIFQGIELHRAIDNFTDEHELTREAKKIFKPDYGLYSGPFVDIVFDHFLANDLSRFTNESLTSFTFDTYEVLDQYTEYQPQRFALMFPSMIRYNWLLNYQYEWGIERSFQGLAHRAKYLEESNKAFVLFLKYYSKFEHIYHDFFPELQEFAEIQLTLNNSKI